MPTLKITETEITQAVLRLASVQKTLPDEVVKDIELLVNAVDERGAKLFQLAKDARDPQFRDKSGHFIQADRIIIVLERPENI